MWRHSGLIATFEDLDDDHGAAAARAQRSFGLVGRIVGRRGGDVEQTAGAFEMILAPGAGEQARVADAVESARQGVEQEAANELVSGQRHDLLAVGAALAIIFISEGDPGLIEAEEAAVRYRNAVGVARQIGTPTPGPGDRRLGIVPPPLLPDGGRSAGRRVGKEGA